jgi:hypothetical protein
MIDPTRPSRVFVLFVLALFATACGAGSAERAGAGGAGGNADDAAAGRTGTDAGASDVDDASARAAACVEKPTALRSAGSVLSFAIAPRLGGESFRFGDANAVPAGGTVTPLNFRFYVSHVALLPAAGAPVPVDLVTATGGLEPYGIHLFNAEDPTSQTLRVLAPPGAYAGVTFTLGIDDACNSGTPAERSPPLTDSSQMAWPHLAGYLFLRYEAQAGVSADAGTDAGTGAATDASASDLPPLIHMGGLPGAIFAPTVTVRGAISVVAGQAANETLALDVGAIYAGATAAVDPATLMRILPFPEVLAGERLRQHVPGLALFVLAP